MSRPRSVIDRIIVFTEWWTDDKSWFTLAQFAEILDCNVVSVLPSLSWLRRNGYIITRRWVWAKRCNLYRVERGEPTTMNKQVGRSKAVLHDARSKLESRVERTLQKLAKR
jgi:hypothetical protein